MFIISSLFIVVGIAKDLSTINFLDELNYDILSPKAQSSLFIMAYPKQLLYKGIC